MKSSAGKAEFRRTVAVRLMFAALCLAIAYLVFELGRISAGYNVIDAAKERSALEQEILTVEERNQGLNEQIALLETHRDIDREAYKAVEQNLAKLQAKIQEQQDAIGFYKGIVSPADGNAGLRVQDFKLQRGKMEREFSMRLVLVQAKTHDRKVSGDIEVRIIGVEDGKERSYSYKDLLVADQESKLAFSFRYFQTFDREILLPDGFTPQTVMVEVESRTKSIASIEQSYSWLSSQG